MKLRDQALVKRAGAALLVSPAQKARRAPAIGCTVADMATVPGVGFEKPLGSVSAWLCGGTSKGCQQWQSRFIGPGRGIAARLGIGYGKVAQGWREAPFSSG